MDSLTERLEEQFLEAGRLTVLPLSATTGEGVEELMPALVGCFHAWSKRYGHRHRAGSSTGPGSSTKQAVARVHTGQAIAQAHAVAAQGLGGCSMGTHTGQAVAQDWGQ